MGANGSPADAGAEGPKLAARAALELVSDGMRLGLGTGRAAEAFVRELGEAVRAGLRVRGVTTSPRTETLAASLGISLGSLEEIDRLDIAFDGADEATDKLELTKGRGGALVRERVVAHAAERFVVLVTPDKLVEKLGSKTPIPIEVVPFARPVVLRDLARLGGAPRVRTMTDGKPYVTDNGNAIIDADFGPIEQPALLDAAIRAIPGVIDTGLFLGMAHLVLVGAPEAVRRLGG